MMTKITLAAALFFAAVTAAQAASDDEGKRDRQGSGWSFHTGPLGQHLGGRGSWWGDQSRTYGYVPRYQYIRHHHPVR
jgi:opacity protein-like surface antigen